MSSQAVKPDVICVTETKLGKQIDDSEVNISGYCIHRQDRNRRGGGVAVYYKDNLEAVPLDLTSTPCLLLECAAVKLTSRLKSILVVCIYRPPSSKAEWVTRYHNCLEYLLSLKMPLVITGDFNYDLLSDTSFAVNINAAYNLKQVIREPTRITKTSCTLLDHFYIYHAVAINNPNPVHTFTLTTSTALPNR
jgi:exonuclease III